MKVNSDGNIETPLPFKKDEFFPNNCSAVYRREMSIVQRIKTEPAKLHKCLEFMQNSIDCGHVERVPNEELHKQNGKVWFIPVFPVSHPRKEKVRLVFDSAAQYSGHSLNAKLLQGPDQCNRLRGVLIRFRQGEVGFVADVQAMFHSFYVTPEHRDVMRFFWFSDNDPKKIGTLQVTCAYIWQH